MLLWVCLIYLLDLENQLNAYWEESDMEEITWALFRQRLWCQRWHLLGEVWWPWLITYCSALFQKGIFHFNNKNIWSECHKGNIGWILRVNNLRLWVQQWLKIGMRDSRCFRAFVFLHLVAASEHPDTTGPDIFVSPLIIYNDKIKTWRTSMSCSEFPN